MTGKVQQILASADSVGSEFNAPEEKMFILLTDHAGGDWILQIKNPDGDWKDIADDSGGVQFDSDGLTIFYCQAYLPYRLNGGTAGAKAWLISGEKMPGYMG